ncbi:hypothetical protein RUE5091_03949 [Ruegeria denitrificans]|uniref:Sulfotransferase domain-containing protein n=1 Tax=Ruegeria denitrificans TaxID=1715692 RepID=A0A0N7MAU5_9RHOB|nr:hypothetical protein [Ruegeria denitrificans]CUK16096.1 hypothetical protein RUE5091_03949 [Ruegeria denitrificans]
MFDALWKAQKRRRLWPKPKASFERELSQAALYPGNLVKTHDFPSGLRGRDDVKVLFCYGPTKASAFSVFSVLDRFGRDWINQHFANLHAEGTFEDLFKYDVLNQADQMRRWATFDDVPVLCLSYDAIWRRQSEVADFLDLNFTLPERTERAKKSIPEEILEQASAAYDPIDAVLSDLPELFVASPKYADILKRLPEHRPAAA